MIEFDLDRSIAEPTWPGLHVYVRFSGVRSYMALLNEYVPLMQDQAIIRWKASDARLKLPSNRAELQERLDDLEVKLDHDIAGNFYGAFVVSVSAALESSLANICDYVRIREQHELSLADLREPSAVKRALLYLHTVMRVQMPTSTVAGTPLRDLQNVRNALAHANGRVSEQRSERRRELESLAASGDLVNIKEDFLLVQPAFLIRSLEAAESLVNELLSVVGTKYPVASVGAP